MSDSQLLTLGSVAGALVTAILTGLVMVLNALHKNAQEKRASRFAEQEAIMDRQEKQIARLEAQVAEQQKAIDYIQELNADYREELAELRMYHTVLLDYTKRTFEKAGLPCDPLPEPPAPRHRQDDSEFIARTTAQNTGLLKDLDGGVPAKES